MPRAKRFLWVDLEATGSSVDDPILEIGVIVTDTVYPFAELAEMETVVVPSDPAWAARMPPVVAEMHAKNGLAAEVTDRWSRGWGPSVSQAEDAVLSVLAAHGKPHDYLLAGSGVGHYDRKMIDAQMPRVSKWLQYPNLDVGVIRRAFDFAGRKDLQQAGLTWAGDSRDDKPHRGLADVRDHLEEFRAYCEMFQAVNWPVFPG